MTPIYLVFFAALLFVVAVLLFLLGLAKDNQKINFLKHELKDATAEIKRLKSDEKVIHAQYCMSDFEKTKFKTDAAMNSAIRTRLAMLIANDIVRVLGEPGKRMVGEGVNQYEYIVKITNYGGRNNTGPEQEAR